MTTNKGCKNFHFQTILIMNESKNDHSVSKEKGYLFEKNSLHLILKQIRK